MSTPLLPSTLCTSVTTSAATTARSTTSVATISAKKTTTNIITSTAATTIAMRKKSNTIGRRFFNKMVKNATYYLPTQPHSTKVVSLESKLQQQNFQTIVTKKNTKTPSPFSSLPKRHFGNSSKTTKVTNTITPHTTTTHTNNKNVSNNHSTFKSTTTTRFSLQNNTNPTNNQTATTATTTIPKTKNVETKLPPTMAGLYRTMAIPLSSTGLLAGGSALYLNFTNDHGQVFQQKIDLTTALPQSLDMAISGQQNYTIHPSGNYTDTDNSDNDDDDEQQVLVVKLDKVTHLPTDVSFQTQRRHVSLDSNKHFTTTESDKGISSSATSSADIDYAQSQFSSQTTTTTTTQSDHTRKTVNYNNTPSQLNYARRNASTTTSATATSSNNNLTGSSDLSSGDEAIDYANPPIIGAPPTDFQHPLDLKYSSLYKFFFGLRRLCTIIWTFMPFIRHYAWTHVLHSPTPADRAQMLQNMSKCIEQSGCAFIKFGQWLSMRPDIFPPDVIAVLELLRDGAPEHEYEQTRQIFFEEFGLDIEEVFSSFNKKAVASGSIAQVYRGKIRPQFVEKMNIRDAKGNLLDEVAIKVRHPTVLQETWVDLDIIYSIVDRIPGLCIPFNKSELKLMIQYQIDFRFEGHYLSRFRRNFSQEIHQGYIAFPYVSPQSLRQAVLIESWAQGQTVSDIFTEVGELFKPVNIGQVARPKETTFWDDLRIRINATIAVIRESIVTTVYQLADEYDVKVDGFNSIKNRDNSVYGETVLERLLHKILPPRGRSGEVAYKWDKNLTDDENRRAEQKKILAYTLFDMFIKMFLRDNLIHADLHAGNVLYDNQSYKHTATVLDAGMTVALESDVMSQFGLFLLSICRGDPNSLVEACSRFEVNLPNAQGLTLLTPLPNSQSSRWERLPIPNGSGIGLLATNFLVRSKFHHDINEIFTRFYSKSKVWGAELAVAENVSIGDVVGQVLLAMQTHGVILRGDVAASIMAMSVIEGLLRQLDPDLDIVVNALPYFLRYKDMDISF